MKTLYRIWLALWVAALLSCAGAPVGWGGTYKVVHSNSRQVTIEYDPLLCSYKTVTKAAEAYAAQYGKVAVPQSGDAGGIKPTKVFTLEAP